MSHSLIYQNPVVMALVTPTMSSIFAPENARLLKIQNDIVQKNHSLGGHEYSFVYNGEVWHRSDVPLRAIKGLHIKPIDPSLVPDIESLSELQRALGSDRLKVLQAFSVIFPRCRGLQDLRDVLPEPIVALVHDLRGIHRLNDEGFVLQNAHPTLRSQFEKATNIALSYIANRFVY